VSSGLAYVGDPDEALAALRELIEAAEQSVVLQMYLFAANGDLTLLRPRPNAFAYADAVAGWLIEKKRARPDVDVVVLLDTNTPANPALTRRRGVTVRRRLREAGVVVLNACLFGTRFDSRRRLLPAMNFHLDWRRDAARGGGAGDDGWVERQNRWQFLHNVEDHRKNLVIDGGRAGAITSHNFFDAAFDWHENLFLLAGDVARGLSRVAAAAIAEALTIPQAIDASERAALEALAHGPGAGREGGAAFAPQGRGFVDDGGCALVENEAIRGRLEAMFEGAGRGDELLVATTYFSDLPVLAALERAAGRGARVRVLVDSIDALPLPPVSGWLTRNLVNHRAACEAARVQARLPGAFEWRTHDSRGGAMMHLKTAARLGTRPRLIGGQANYTPNSFSGAWLETDLETGSADVVAAFARHFERLWGLEASRPSPARRPPGPLQMGLRSSLLWFFGLLGLRP
jgi:phosphatidylserine/phosphatidylglycerophosphate/cardiolipin synthase-like enzyme